MATDYIPNADADFDNWQSNFVLYANTNLAALGLVALDMTPVVNAQNSWKVVYPNHLTAIFVASSAKVVKDNSRAVFEAAIRPLVRRLQASSSVDSGEKAALGITVPGSNPVPSGPPTTMPVIRVACERLMHTLSWTDSATPTRRAKPAGVLGAEIRMALTAIGAPTPIDPGVFTFLALDTATPYLNEFDAVNGGKNAHYIARWVSGQQEHGPWSETVSVTVGV